MEAVESTKTSSYATIPSAQPPKLLDQVRQAIRVRHYSIRTEEAYLTWIKRVILFRNNHRPRGMGAKEVQQFLSHLAVKENVAAATQNQCLCALIFLYKKLLNIQLPEFNEIVCAKKPAKAAGGV